MSLLNWKSFLIGLLTSIIILMSAYIYFEGGDYRQISRRPPLSVKETVGTLPNGLLVERYVVPYRGRFHYVYVCGDVTTVNKKTMNGRTTNMETNVFLNPKK